jgi:hypothetical protein
MPRAAAKTREEARRLYLTGEVGTNSEIAARIGVKPQTVASWRREEDWDGLRRKVDRRAAELFVEKLATDRVTLNSQHFQIWGLIAGRLVNALKSEQTGAVIQQLDRAASILDRVQKGQRLARGLATDGETEEQIRAEAQAEIRHLIDTFIDAIKENVTDEAARDQIRLAILRAIPDTESDRARDPGDPS